MSKMDAHYQITTSRGVVHVSIVLAVYMASLLSNTPVSYVTDICGQSGQDIELID